MYYVIAVLVFGALILIHELGHFLMARLFGVTVNEFAIGMGPKLLSRVSKKSGTRYSLRLLPFGGYVSMLGEDEDVEEEGAFSKKKAWQRLIIVVAGAVMNLLLGFLVMTILVTQIKVFGTTKIAQFTAEDAPSHLSGLEAGDIITEVDGTNVHIDYELLYEIMRKGNAPVDLTVIRDGEELLLKDVTFPSATESGVTFGDIDFRVYGEERSFGVVIKHAFFRSVSTVRIVWESIGDLITGRYGMEAVSGPVGVAGAIADTAKVGFSSLMYMVALISVNLGVCNLLPLPALDGGRLVFLLIETVTGKRIDPKYEGYVHFAGLILLLALMAFVTYKDIFKLITG